MVAESQQSSSSSINRGARWSLNGMTALVTGGTRGIGHAIVNDLAAFGAAVHTCSRNQTELNKCLQEWQSQGFEVTGSVCDVSSPPQREKLIQEAASTFNGKLNIYVNHCPIVVKNKVYGWGSKPFRILNGWFQDRRFFEVVKEAWKKQDVVRWET
ncbi:hypothetical protein D0Y65_036899 [Glycine soja]|uniref:Tropinone reductase-like n=1 Tax=Glycine soja TaxID=3848 RepID=A0A445HGS1_GLYSO|nr:hypothetical protein D0Y65_036899 [Glycine soja]